jgi:hypothetical protein
MRIQGYYETTTEPSYNIFHFTTETPNKGSNCYKSTMNQIRYVSIEEVFVCSHYSRKADEMYKERVTYNSRQIT